jgi:diacylglycerol kinase family enzyme
MRQASTVDIILNVSAGAGGKELLPPILEEVFRRHGMSPRFHWVRKGMDLIAIAKGIVDGGAEIVVACGGDGTLNAVASALAGSGVAFGVLPAGTLNHFARDLQIPFDPAAAAEVIAAGHSIQVDLGEVNGRIFINNAIIGLYPAYRFQRHRREKLGYHRFFAIVGAMFSVFRRNPSLKVRVDAGHSGLIRQTPFLMVSNNRHEMEGYHLGLRRSLSEGELWIYVMHRMSRLGLVRLALSILLGQFSKWRDFDLLQAEELTVESRRRRIGISLDGEVLRMAPPLHYRCLPGALRVLVPKADA